MNQIPIKKENGFALGNLFASGLSPLENKAVLMRANGQTIKQIAKLLGCSANNIKQSLNNVFYKLHANNTPEVIAKAFTKAYLRALGFMGIAIAILLSSPTIDHKTIARNQGNRPGQHRVRTSARPQSDGGILWDPETGELIFA